MWKKNPACLRNVKPQSITPGSQAEAEMQLQTDFRIRTSKSQLAFGDPNNEIKDMKIKNCLESPVLEEVTYYN